MLRDTFVRVRIRIAARRALLAATVACLSASSGGCSGGFEIPVDLPPHVQMERWESIDSVACRGRLNNLATETAHDVRVYFQYRTTRGDTTLIFSPASTTIAPNARVSVSVPPQVTGGVLRFPRLAKITWEGDSLLGEGPPLVASSAWPWACLPSPDSARGLVLNVGGLAYNVVINVETVDGVAQVPLRQDALGGLLYDPRNTPSWEASIFEGWGTFHAALRDSAGVKLPPRVISVRWENFAGDVDSLNASPDPWPSSLQPCR